MQLEQAIFTSSQRSRIKGYQLVCRSEGIDRNMAQELCRWSPSQLPESGKQDDWFLSVYPLNHGFTAIARTVRGGPEYSCRGGNRVVTMIGLVSPNQLSAYHYDPCRVAFTALALGYMRMPLEIPRSLAPIELPNAPFSNSPFDVDSPQTKPADNASTGPDSTPGWAPNLTAGDLQAASPNASLIIESAELLKARQRITIVGVEQPMEFMLELLPQLSEELRKQTSFTTGLLPSPQRPFDIHFFTEADQRLQASMEGQNIRLLQSMTLGAS